MTIEEQLKEYILDRYKSIREFTIVVDMSYSTVDSILKRGIGNSSVNNIIKICKVLNISVDALANGEIVPVQLYKKPDDVHDVGEILESVKDQIISNRGFTIDGKPLDQKSKSSIVESMSIGLELAKRNLNS